MGKTLRVLIIDDSEDDALLLARHLKQEGIEPVTERVDTTDALRSTVTAFEWDVILCDVNMPRLDTLGALEVVRSVGVDVPFIVVSGTVGEERLIELMKAGAHDIIVKDRLSRLLPAIEREIEEAAVRRERKESEERFRVAFEAAPHGIALVGLDGPWLKVNRAVTEMLGYEEREILSTDFRIVTHPDDIAADLDLVRRVMDGEIESYQVEKRYIRKDGQIVTALQSVSLVRKADGSPVHFVFQLLDLTGRKELEAQLLQAQKMEAVGQLTGGVAHDFNNLLTVIMGNARLLERRLANGDSVAVKNLDAIVGAARRGADLTYRLLAFSRKEKLEPKVVDGGELVSGMLDMMRRTLGATIEIKTRFADESLSLLADPNLLEGALLNLATNARDAMPEGGTLSIALDCSRVEEDNCHAASRIAVGEYVVLSVSDTGSGIPAEHRDHIFEPFFTTKEVGKGTGLGLSMVFGFAEQSGGHVRVESEMGRGTTFRLYLPKAQGAAAPEVGFQDLEEPAANGHGTILVVEDEPDVRAIAVAMLGDLGYRVIESENGPDALAKLDGHRDIDLLFTDIVMPGGMTGPDLAERAREGNPGLKVLFTTGYAGEAAANGGLPDGIAVLTKPYEAAELAEKVRQSLGTPQ